MFLICDIAGEHFLRLDGYWCAMPVSGDDLRLLAWFGDRDAAERYCRRMLAQGCHCRPCGISLS